MSVSVTRREALLAAGGGAAALAVAGCNAPGRQEGVAEAEAQVASVEPLEDTSGWDAAFYRSAYASVEEARVASEAVAEEVEAGGIVLLRNEGGALPLAAVERVSLLGRGAADPVYDGTGAAFIDLGHAVDLRSACAAAGLDVNDAAFDFLAAEAPNHPRATVGTLDAPETVSYYLGEVPWSSYPQDVCQSVDGTVGIVVISRPSGEGADLSQDLLGSLGSGVSQTFLPNEETANYVEGQHQLELCAEELELLREAKARCKKLVVLLNVATTMEVGPLVEPGGPCEADAILEIGFPGESGLLAVAHALTGEVNPSGRTCDLWAADLSATPSFNNFGDHTYTDVTDYYTSIGSGAHFVEYAEGVYVGYRYYETAAAEAATGNYPGFDYDAAVTFPFGFGLSYTSFGRELLDVAHEGEDLLARVHVTNEGQVAGRDVVEIYATAPVRKGLEKSAAVLVAFAKTDELAPGEAAELELRFSERDLASWDVSAGCWVLDEGSYAISLRSDSHTVIDQREVSLGKKLFQTDSATGNPVQNRFDDVTDYMDAYVTQLSRSDFAGTFPAPAQDKTAASVGLELKEYDAAEHVDPSDEMPVTREKNGISLSDLRGRPMDDPLWEKLLDQLAVNVMTIILNNHDHGTDSVDSVGKPKTREGDGPAGIGIYVDDGGHCGFPSEYAVAQSWDRELVRKMGEAMADEMLVTGMNGWHAPAMNTHRSPFGGRDFEYYSEDPLLAGTLGTAMVEAVFSRGIYAQMKHFCLNDQDTNRSAHLLTWASEQAIREIYARPFEIVVKNARGSLEYLDDQTGERKTKGMSAAIAVMSSYNYTGSTWAGGSKALCTELLRDEWGFEGHVVSDWSLYDYTNKNQAFYAGTDVNLTTTLFTGQMHDSESATAVKAMRRCMHRYLYSIANSNAMNGKPPTVRVTYK